jgi:hypothetical protein
MGTTGFISANGGDYAVDPIQDRDHSGSAFGVLLKGFGEQRPARLADEGLLLFS